MPASTLQPGLEHRFAYRVPDDKTVPHLYAEAPELATMPAVFASGYMVGLIEWTCVQLLAPHLDGPDEQSVGIHLDLSHEAATPAGFDVTVTAVLTAVDGRRLTFEITAHDGVDTISRGRHQRFIIDATKFNERVAEAASA
jgi:fluoroacetyl-CoA thioesterase